MHHYSGHKQHWFILNKQILVYDQYSKILVHLQLEHDSVYWCRYGQFEYDNL